MASEPQMNLLSSESAWLAGCRWYTVVVVAGAVGVVVATVNNSCTGSVVPLEHQPV